MLLFQVVVEFIEAVGIMALTAIFYGMLQRVELRDIDRSVLTGLTFGAGAVISMLSPVQLSNGGIMDGRAVFVGLGAAFGGIPAAIVAAGIVGGTRLYIGGMGAVAGATGVIAAALLGLVWIWLCNCKGQPKLRHLAMAGAMISLQFFTILFFRIPNSLGFVTSIYPLLFVYSVAASLMLGVLVERERKLVESEKSLKRAAEIDYLTELMNRRAFEVAAQNLERLSHREGRVHTVAILDLDHFKNINDSWGHEAGDKALSSFADVLRSVCRGGDMVARVGGEEFVVLLRDTPLKDASKAIHRILDATRKLKISTEAGDFSLTASAGVAEFTPPQVLLDKAMALADSALYTAKESGRDKVEFAGYSVAR